MASGFVNLLQAIQEEEMLLLWSLMGLIPMLAMVNAYQKFYTFELSCDNKDTPFKINLTESGLDSAAIVRASPTGGFPPKTCYIEVSAPNDVGIIFHIKFVKLKIKDETECSNKLQLTFTENKKSEEAIFCDDRTLFYVTDPGSHFKFTFFPSHESTNASSRMNFDVTFTAFHHPKGGECGENYFGCPSKTSKKCIWKPYKCDVRDNCDRDTDSFCEIYTCNMMVTYYLTSISVGIIVVGLLCIFGMVIKYLISRRRKNEVVDVPATKSDLLLTPPIATPKSSSMKFHQHESTSYS